MRLGGFAHPATGCSDPVEAESELPMGARVVSPAFSLPSGVRPKSRAIARAWKKMIPENV